MALRLNEKRPTQRDMAAEHLRRKYPEVPGMIYRGVACSEFEKNDLIRMLAEAKDRADRMWL